VRSDRLRCVVNARWKRWRLFLVRGSVQLPGGTSGAAVLEAIVVGLERRLRNVESGEQKVQFSVEWGEYRTPSTEWISAVDGGRFWIAETDPREVRYELYAVRSRLIVPGALLVGFLSSDLGRPLIGVSVAVVATLLLLIPSHLLAQRGARRFLANRISACKPR
jgi:hypothetical protein